MDRDPRVTPLPGDRLLLSRFGGGGGTFIEVRRVSETGRRMHRAVTVGCRLSAVDGRKIAQPGRYYDLSTWPAFMRGCLAVVVTKAEEASNV